MTMTTLMMGAMAVMITAAVMMTESMMAVMVLLEHCCCWAVFKSIDISTLEYREILPKLRTLVNGYYQSLSSYILKNGNNTQVLVDLGLLGDFIPSTLVDKLQLKQNILEKMIGLLLAVQGSRSKINTTINVNFEYQGIATDQSFNVANLSDYDMILGTHWMY